MFQIIYKYFALQNKLDLPGIGCFSISSEAAKLDFGNKTLHAPIPIIKFNKNCGPDDKNLSAFIAHEKGVTHEDASRQLEDFSLHLKEEIKALKIVELPNMGTLKKGSDGLVFENINFFESYFPPVVAERILREDAKHNILVGDLERTSTEMQEYYEEEDAVTNDRWWLWALLLAVFAIGAIGYYYLYIAPAQVY